MKKVIAVLTKGYENIHQYNELIKRNNSIERNLKEHCPVVIFHEGNIIKEHQNFISSKTNISLTFIEIPPFSPKENIEFLEGTESFGWGYRHMCNFWFIDFWKYTNNYDLLLRIDEDCEISFNIDKIFKLLEQKVCIYGKWVKDSEFVTKGIARYFNEYFAKCNHSEIKEASGPYTNVVGFNLVRLRENKKLFKFIKKLKEDKFIFTHRWGDLPLWGGILSVLFSKNEYVEENMISYFHKSHEAIVNPRISVLFVKKYLKHFIKKVIPLKILIYAKKYTNYG